MTKRSNVIALDAVDKSTGKKTTHKLRARFVNDPGRYNDEIKRSRIAKQEDTTDIEVSRAIEDEFRALMGGSKQLVPPPFNLAKLVAMRNVSTVLGQAASAMVQNTVGFGYQLRERRFREGARDKLSAEIAHERDDIDEFLASVHPKHSLTQLLKRVVFDKHMCGNGYLEMIEDRGDELVGLNHLHGHTVRMTKMGRPVRTRVPVVRPSKGYRLEYRNVWHRFRRFVQIRDHKLVWFKEAGDPRHLDYRTGKFEDDLPPRRRATSLLHFSLYHPTSPYGVPWWIGASFAVWGSWFAEEVNWTTIRNNNIPAMFVIVENGILTDESTERLAEWVEHQIAGQANYSKFIILEGMASEEGSPNPAAFKIRVEPLHAVQKQDQLYQEYLKNNDHKVQRSFRIPPLYFGDVEAFNKATSDTARTMTDEQVFAPERTDQDHLINRFLLLRRGARFHALRHNHPNITDDIELIRLMGIGERSGAVTPRRADRIMQDVFGDDLGTLPQGIDLDTPYSLQFAQAQGGGGAGGARTAGDDAGKELLGSILQLRDNIEKELSARLDDERLVA